MGEREAVRGWRSTRVGKREEAQNGGRGSHPAERERRRNARRDLEAGRAEVLEDHIPASIPIGQCQRRVGDAQGTMSGEQISMMPCGAAPAFEKAERGRLAGGGRTMRARTHLGW